MKLILREDGEKLLKNHDTEESPDPCNTDESQIKKKHKKTTEGVIRELKKRKTSTPSIENP